MKFQSGRNRVILAVIGGVILLGVVGDAIAGVSSWGRVTPGSLAAASTTSVVQSTAQKTETFVIAPGQSVILKEKNLAVTLNSVNTSDGSANISVTPCEDRSNSCASDHITHQMVVTLGHSQQIWGPFVLTLISVSNKSARFTSEMLQLED